MAYFTCYKVVITLAILLLSLSSFSAHPPPTTSDNCSPVNILATTQFIVRSIVKNAVAKEARMGASLLRLHFHDCFVNGCDASILLDDNATASIKSEKNAGANQNSVRGFEVIDDIKKAVEDACPGVVSCADILALAAMQSVSLLGGPVWEVSIGRRDSKTAHFDEANNGSIPTPNSNLTNLINRFNQLNLTSTDLVALSGAHTIGQAKCTSFRGRIYNDTNIDSTFATQRKAQCAKASGKTDNNTAPLDSTPKKFDNQYFQDLAAQKGLLHSDQELFNIKGGGQTNNIVNMYKDNLFAFHVDFANAMIKMGNIGLLTGNKGEIRTNCRVPN
ncbi:hypothetical protein CASFOL_003101 [Castilleja foliolosa]|uniref:Peroxidase n=1 Tax=Castilleja foliolosa TaxID=1961234 RepID=A0ABD3EGK5_9LAMI